MEVCQAHPKAILKAQQHFTSSVPTHCCSLPGSHRLPSTLSIHCFQQGILHTKPVLLVVLHMWPGRNEVFLLLNSSLVECRSSEMRLNTSVRLPMPACEHDCKQQGMPYIFKDITRLPLYSLSETTEPFRLEATSKTIESNH